MADPRDFGFEIVHFGVNVPGGDEAADFCAFFSAFFGIAPAKDGTDSVFAGPRVEVMKGKGRGLHGHIGVGTRDYEGAKAYLEGRGLDFDPASAKRDGAGREIVVYLRRELAGFAVHLLRI